MKRDYNCFSPFFRLLLTFIAFENMGVNLKFHVTNAFLCFIAFGNVGGG